jgi:hypothetical protein
VEVETGALAGGFSTLPPVAAGLGAGVCATELSAHRRITRQSLEMIFIKRKSRLVA